MRSSLIIAVLLFAACQPVPQPFRHGADPPGELVELSDANGIIVLPVSDAAPGKSEELSAEMVVALHQRNIPATVGRGSRSSYLLLGGVTTAASGRSIVWSLLTPDGEELGRVRQQFVERTETRSPQGVLATFAGTAAAVASMIQENAPSETVPPRVHVGPVAGAPGDGNSRLRAAIEQLLPRTGVKLAQQPAPDSLVVTGAVRLGPARGGEQEVEIAWTVRDPFGAEVGTIAQSRPVAAGSLDDNWGLLANEAAMAASVGIAELVRQIDWSTGFQPPARGKAPGGSAPP